MVHPTIRLRLYRDVPDSLCKVINGRQIIPFIVLKIIPSVFTAIFDKVMGRDFNKSQFVMTDHRVSTSPKPVTARSLKDPPDPFDTVHHIRIIDEKARGEPRLSSRPAFISFCHMPCRIGRPFCECSYRGVSSGRKNSAGCSPPKSTISPCDQAPHPIRVP